MRVNGKTKLGFFPLPAAEADLLKKPVSSRLNSPRSILVWVMASRSMRCSRVPRQSAMA